MLAHWIEDAGQPGHWLLEVVAPELHEPPLPAPDLRPPLPLADLPKPPRRHCPSR